MRHERAEDAAVGDGEDAAFHVGQRDLAVARFLGVGADGLFHAGEGELVGVAHDGDEEALVGRDGAADVVEIVLHDFVAVDARS